VVGEDPGTAAHRFRAKEEEGTYHGWLSMVMHGRREGNDSNGVDCWLKESTGWSVRTTGRGRSSWQQRQAQTAPGGSFPQ
jgi:hypothetical protein